MDLRSGACPRPPRRRARPSAPSCSRRPRGYCAGVDRAVITVEKALDLYGAPVYVRKQIVHNKHVVADLEARGAVFVEELDEVPEGATVVFSAHGVSPAVHVQAAERGLKTIDATCPLVTKVHHEARRFAKDDYDILLIGHEGHEEVEGTAGEAPEHIQLVQTPRTPRTWRCATRARWPGCRRPRCRSTRRWRTVDALRANVPRAARPAEGRHLLRHPEPPGGGQGDLPRRRPGDRRGLGATRPTRCAWSRSRSRPARRASYRVDDATRDRRVVARRASPRWASPRVRRCPRTWSTGVLDVPRRARLPGRAGGAHRGGVADLRAAARAAPATCALPVTTDARGQIT